MPQGTSASWGAIRQDGQQHMNLTIATAKDHQDLVKVAEDLAETHDYIVIDGPPRIAEITRAMLILSDLCLIPLGASAAEIWATSDLLTTINDAKTFGKEIGKKIDARIIWNRYRGTTNAAKEMPAAVKEELGLPALDTKLGYRVAYSDALARGMTVLEWPDRAARDEMEQLCREVGKIIKAKLI
jgi:chromosome partitioning protein